MLGVFTIQAIICVERGGITLLDLTLSQTSDARVNCVQPNTAV